MHLNFLSLSFNLSQNLELMKYDISELSDDDGRVDIRACVSTILTGIMAVFAVDEMTRPQVVTQPRS
jgi:hypothetical protein